MSGPTSMMLGAFAFESLGFGTDNVARSVKTPWADIAVAQVLNQQQWTGPTSEDLVIKGVLFSVEFGGQDSLDGIIAASLAGTPMMFVSGDAAQGLIHGLFTVQSVDEDRSLHTAFGAPRRNAYSIALKRYGGVSGFTGGAVQSSLDLFG